MAKKQDSESGRVSTIKQGRGTAEAKAPSIASYGKIKTADLPKKIAPGKEAEIIETAHSIAKAMDRRAAAVKKARELNDLIDEAEAESAAAYNEALQKHGPAREDALRKASRLNETIKAASSALVAAILDPHGKLAFSDDGSDGGED